MKRDQNGKQTGSGYGRIMLGILVLLVTIGFLSACASHTSRTQELMATDYKSLSNEDLTLYYYQLDDQIVIVEQPRSKPRLGLGFGLGGSHIGGGVGVSTGVGSDNVATDLRERRNQVRLELQQRGITP